MDWSIIFSLCVYDTIIVDVGHGKLSFCNVILCEINHIPKLPLLFCMNVWNFMISFPLSEFYMVNNLIIVSEKNV